MMQCKFKDLESNLVHGGIMLDNGDIICACCGGIIERDECGCYGDSIKILDKYNTWVDFSEFIVDELSEEE